MIFHGITVSDSDGDFEDYPPFKMQRYSPINISSDDEDANQPCSSKGKGSKKIDGRVKSIEDRLLKLEGAHSSEGNSDQKYCTIVNEIKEEMRCFICKLILSRDCHCCHAAIN